MKPGICTSTFDFVMALLVLPFFAVGLLFLVLSVVVFRGVDRVLDLEL